MKYTIRPVPVRTGALLPWLIRAHYEEVSDKSRTLKVDWLKYQSMEQAGILLTLAAFDEDDDIVGYSVSVVDTNVHYSDLCMAYNSALFVHPDHRATSLGGRLMVATKAECKAAGASLMLWHSKPDSPLNTLLTKRKLKVQDIIHQEPL